jgi:hypothetical protein
MLFFNGQTFGRFVSYIFVFLFLGSGGLAFVGLVQAATTSLVMS